MNNEEFEKIEKAIGLLMANIGFHWCPNCKNWFEIKEILKRHQHDNPTPTPN